MTADVVLLPAFLHPEHLAGRTVVVFDVLRATTTMTAALAVGVKEIRIFGDLESARRAASAADPSRVLCGEDRCLPPPGFDLGNSPASFVSEQHFGRTVLMSTTNGTRAIVAAAGAHVILAGALVNARATARAAARLGRNVTLLCAGTNGAIATEDLLGAGAVLDELKQQASFDASSDTAQIATLAFHAARDNLPAALSASAGGRNVIAAGLDADIAFAARLNSLDIVGAVRGEPPVLTPWQDA